MREILFRGKREDSGEWLEGNLLVDPDLGSAQIIGFEYWVSETGIESGEFGEFVDHRTVGQYTGLKDKNGKRIFEGDVLRAEFEVDDELRTTSLRVMWFRNAWHSVEGNWGPELIEEEEVMGDCEVIGNIHDNPELMEGYRWEEV